MTRNIHFRANILASLDGRDLIDLPWVYVDALDWVHAQFADHLYVSDLVNADVHRLAGERRVHFFESSGEAYDQCNCDDSIRRGDLLVVASERIVGLCDAWPVAVTEAHGHLHRTRSRIDLVDYAATNGVDWPTAYEIAEKVAMLLGYALHNPPYLPPADISYR